eukprot:Hpha_TRINITY_DN8042_c0_g2::TRINITY_DN8042_c0_g2_i1::g.140000::m.140000
MDCAEVEVEKVKQLGGVPTYRGLYSAAFARYPEAPAAVYSNADILFPAAFSEVVAATVRFAEGRKFLVVGQRVNAKIPPQCNTSDEKAVARVVTGRRLY